MKNPKDIPAFPRVTLGGNLELNAIDGMTLRDYLAGQSLMGMCSQWASYPQLPNEYAIHAYELADAMLKARGES